MAKRDKVAALMGAFDAATAAAKARGVPVQETAQGARFAQLLDQADEVTVQNWLWKLGQRLDFYRETIAEAADVSSQYLRERDRRRQR